MGTGNLKVSDDYLGHFARKHLDDLSTAMTSRPEIKLLVKYASGPASGATPGGDLESGYNQVLPGAVDGPVTDASTLQTNFTTYAKLLADQIASLAANVTKLSSDLQNVDLELAEGEDHANITAAGMTWDLHDLTFGGSDPSGTGSPSPSQTTT